MKCEFCKKETKELKDFWGEQKLCPECIEKEEEHMDESDLYAICDRRGKRWIEQKLSELVKPKL